MKAIKTGDGVAAARAMMMLYPKEKRLFEDPYSEKLLPPVYKFYIWLMRNPKIRDSFIMKKEKSIPGAMGWFFCRERYIDDVLRKTLEKNEFETVVNLGAGMDCRAYYIPEIEKLLYFEVDHPKVIKKKMKKMKKILGKLPDNVVYVPIDFQKQSLDLKLKNAGYNLTFKTLFIWEAVTQYIPKEAIDNTLKYIGQAAPGSKLVFSYVIKSFIDGKYSNDGIKRLAKQFLKKSNPIFISGFNPAEMKDYLSKYSLTLIEDIDSVEMQKRYSNLVDLDLLKTIKEFDIERFVLAEVK
ncbi:MAG: SAM-dependent methyltransferase [Candidatus Marinimicrobia bacterium]|nr:SAM-dependent methyltransferase [Candidatus Neomarinimicrobiota bacterium]